MLDALIALALLALLAGFVMVLRAPQEDDGSPDVAARPPRAPAGGLGGRSWIAVAFAAAVALGLLLIDLPPMIVAAVALLAWIIAAVALRAWAARRDTAFELALAAALDLVVASLRAGAALVESLSTAADEARGEVGEMLTELCERVRLGEPAPEVLDEIVIEHPQEGTRLFAFTLRSHFDSGGSAATSLGGVARAIRDRVDVIRRASAQAVETQASVIGILAITYGLALLMWTQYPERVEVFAESAIGRSAIGASILLQAVGLAWITRMARVEV